RAPLVEGEHVVRALVHGQVVRLDVDLLAPRVRERLAVEHLGVRGDRERLHRHRPRLRVVDLRVVAGRRIGLIRHLEAPAGVVAPPASAPAAPPELLEPPLRELFADPPLEPLPPELVEPLPPLDPEPLDVAPELPPSSPPPSSSANPGRAVLFAHPSAVPPTS